MTKNKVQKNIPKGWKEKKLSDIGKFEKGVGISKKQLSEIGNCAVRYGELYTKHNFQVRNIYSHISDNIISKTKKIESGDILFAGSGETIDEIGKSATYLGIEDCYAGGDIIIFSPKNQNSLYLAYYLNIGSARRELRRLGQGQSVVHIYKKDVEQINVVVPSLVEQKRIVKVLEVWDCAVEKLERKIVVKENIKKGLLQSMMNCELSIVNGKEGWYPKLRLPGFSGEWEEKKLGDVATITTGNSNREDSGLDGEYTFFDRSEDIRTSNIYLFDGEAVIVAGEGQKFIPKYFVGKFDLHQRTYSIMDFNGVNGKFIYFYLYQNHNYLLAQAVGSTVKSLRLPMFIKMPIKLPKFKEQKAIAEILTTADEEIGVLRKKLDILKDQKKFLLNNLVTGEIRVSE